MPIHHIKDYGGRGGQRTMQILAPLVPTLAVVLPDATWMLSPERFTRRESRRSWPSSSVLKLYPSLKAAYWTHAPPLLMSALLTWSYERVMCLRQLMAELCLIGHSELQVAHAASHVSLAIVLAAQVLPLQ